MKLAYALPAVAMLLQAPAISRASDHADGLKTLVDHSADLTDLYTFTSPTDPSKLVLVMSTHSIAFGITRFSDAIDYKFRIRPVDATLTPDGAHEASVVCTFSGILPNQDATCTLHTEAGDSHVDFETRSDAYQAGGDGQADGIRAFAGVRSDTWYLDLTRVTDFNGGKLPDATPGKNGLKGQNVLSIVVEVDKKQLPGTMLAVTAQTVRK